jgi:hypothetical protein
MQVSLENSLNLIIPNIAHVLRSLILNLNRTSKPLTTIMLNERDNEPVNLESQMEIDS